MKRFLYIWLSCWLALTMQAQQMRILQFEKLKKGPLNMRHVVTDKQQAIIDLTTSESGFTFLANGKTEIAAEEGDGMLTLKSPHKTTHIVVKHPEYGQLTWKVPGRKGLLKKKHYTAVLQTAKTDEEYKLQKQWVVFELKPSHAIFTVDSTTSIVNQSKTQLYLPLGKHTYKAEAPFYTEVEDSFELTDQEQLNITVALQPIYSYITVKTPMEGADILIDGVHIGYTQGTSGHLNEGPHQVVIMKGDQKYYDQIVNIGWQEKKVIKLKSTDLKPIATPTPVQQDLAQLLPSAARSTASKETADKKTAGKNKKASKSTYKSIPFATQYTIEEVNDTIAQIPFRETTNYGMLNVHANEIGAQVYIDGKLSGTTPCIVKQLPAGKTCKVRLVKAGFRDTEKVVKVEGNNLAEVTLKLKKK